MSSSIWRYTIQFLQKQKLHSRTFYTNKSGAREAFFLVIFYYTVGKLYPPPPKPSVAPPKKGPRLSTKKPPCWKKVNGGN